jgi:rRNA-processing protein FCF1
MKKRKNRQAVSDEAVLDLPIMKKINLPDQGAKTLDDSNDVIKELFDRYRPFIDRLEKLLKQGT